MDGLVLNSSTYLENTLDWVLCINVCILFSIGLVSLQSCSLTPINWRTLSIVHYTKMSPHISENGSDNELSQNIPKTQMAVVVHGQGLLINHKPRILDWHNNNFNNWHNYFSMMQRTIDTRRSLCLSPVLMRSLSRSRLLESVPAMLKPMQEQRDSGVSWYSEKLQRF